jgi:multiple sugar transport system substrate-binding protein
VVPEQQLRQKLPIELTAESPAVDVFATSLHVEKLLFSAAGWFEPLNRYLENPSLTPPEHNWKDFGPAGTHWGVKTDGAVIALPMGVGPRRSRTIGAEEACSASRLRGTTETGPLC